MPSIQLFEVSSLEKVFLDERPRPTQQYTCASALLGELFSYQAAFLLDQSVNDLMVEVESPIAQLVELYEVKNMPSDLPMIVGDTENCLRYTPGLYPDLLTPISLPLLRTAGLWHSIWVSVDLRSESACAGSYPITLKFISGGNELARCTFNLEVLKASLPEQTLINTHWFHTDCIADYYGAKVFSEKHWEMIEKFMKIAVNFGQNMVLTPMFTPPLDTAPGGERTTVQLVDVSINADGSYSFGFDKLQRWVDTARRSGMKYFELNHMFTQWGAKFTPKIIATLPDGSSKRIFGWDVGSLSAEYRTFLEAFIPCLKEFLDKNGMQDCTMFHVSDEPHGDHIHQYRPVSEHFKSLIAPYQTIEALSDFNFYKEGLIEHPIPASDAIEPFLEAKVPDLWVYFCVAQNKDVCNRFFGMPSERSRIMGWQMFKYDIAGFLQWGFNFYNSQLSRHHINPFVDTSCSGMFPSGDAFQVYPGVDGPLPSLRIFVFNEGLQDMRALQLAASLAGKDKVMEIIEEGIDPITFRHYPRSAEWLLNMRQRINRLIAQHS